MAKHPNDNTPDINAERKKLQNILREPLTRRRLFLAAKLNAARNPANQQPFTLDEFKEFISAIPDTHNMMAKEIEKAMEVVKRGKTSENPDLGNPSSQLLWGATLAWLSLNPAVVQGWGEPPEKPDAKPKPVSITGTEIWKQLTHNPVAAEEKLTHGKQIRETLRSKNTKYDWSAPGTGTQYDRDKDVIHFDLMQNLISGFEHARADIHRQIGFALIVTNYTPRMADVAREMAPLMQKAQRASAKKGPKLGQDEYKKLRLLSTEWQLRNMLFMAAEGNPVNRYAANLSYQFKFMQDIGVSVNNAAVTTRGTGLVSPIMGNDEMPDELKRYMNLCHTVELSFFQNNKLFENTDAAWRQAGVLPELVRTNDTLKKSPGDTRGIDHPDFQHLRELCGGQEGLENQQVNGFERMFGNFMGRIASRDAKRKEIIAEIETKYTDHLLQKLLEQANDQVEQELEQSKQNDQQDGQEQDGEEQDGQEQDGQQGQGQGKSKGKPKKGQKSQGGGGQGGGEPGESGEGDDDSGEQQKGQKGQKDQQQKDADGNDSGDGKEGKDGKDKKKGKGAGDIGKDEDKNVPVEGAGDMPGVQKSAETPEEQAKPGKDADGDENDGDGKDGDGQDGDGNDADGDDGDSAQTLEEMMKEQAERAAQEQEENDADGDDADGQSQDGGKQGKKGSKSKQPGGRKAGHGGGRSLGDLAKEDWTQYDKRVAELREPIGRARKLFKEIQKRQLQPKKAVSRQLEILPENGEVMERFNIEAHRNLIVKKATREVEEHDLKRFHTDERIMVPTEVDIVILIDGSGSMVPSPLDSAMQAGAILFEAANAKDMKMNVYVGLWGNEDPPILIQPGDTPTKIGQTMQAYRRGLNSGTDLAPAIRNTAKVIGEQRGRAGTLSGFTHILVISDGDIGDAEAAIKVIDTMFTHSDKTTVDTAVISNLGRETEMERMANNASKKMARKDYHVVGTVREIDANRVPDSILGLLVDKIRKCGSFKAVPNTEKRRAMKKAHDKMNEGKRRP